MTKKRITILSILLSLCMLLGCASEKGVEADVSATVPHSTAGGDNGAAETTEPAVPDKQQFLQRPPVGGTIYNKYDSFKKNVITVNNSDYVIPEEDVKGLLGVMNYNHYKYYDVGFYVLDLGSQMSFGYNATDYFNPGCTRKAGMALAWFKQLEDTRIKIENGQTFYVGQSTATLNTRYFYDGTDYMAGAGFVGRNGYRWYTYNDLLYYLLHESDNTAYQALWNELGISKYKSMCIRLGIPEHPLDYKRDKLWTPMRPLDLGLIWQEIWNYKEKGSQEAELLWHYVTHNKYNEIAKVVDGADVIAHKAGSDDYGFHEAGIVVRGDNAYVVVAMSTVPLPVANDDYDVIHMVIERIDPIMQDFYASNAQK